MFFFVFFYYNYYKICGNAVRKRAPGALDGESAIIIDVINDLQSKEYRICASSGVDETLRLGLFKSNSVRAPPRLVPLYFPFLLPTEAGTNLDPPTEGNPPSDHRQSPPKLFWY